VGVGKKKKGQQGLADGESFSTRSFTYNYAESKNSELSKKSTRKKSGIELAIVSRGIGQIYEKKITD